MTRRTPVVLLAEDDAEFRELLAESLRRSGYVVLEAGDGLQLEEHLFRTVDGELPDVVVSDVSMPGASGLEVLRAVRERAWATPLVLITANGDAAMHQEATELGAVVLDKPFALKTLHRVVANAVLP